MILIVRNSSGSKGFWAPEDPFLFYEIGNHHGNAEYHHANNDHISIAGMELRHIVGRYLGVKIHSVKASNK